MARTRKWVINLSAEEFRFAKHEKNKACSETLKKRYNVLITANKYPSLSYQEIGHKAGVTEPTVISTLKAFCTTGFEGLSAMNRSPRSDVSRLKVDGEMEATLIAKACQTPPTGATRWTISLLTNEMAIILERATSADFKSVSRSAVGRAMLRNELRPHLNEYWCIPPEEDANFVAAMEDILDVYKLPYDPDYPVWCMDEKPYQLLDDSRKPLPMRPGDIAKVDSEYVRHGTVSIFCFIQPHNGTIVHYVEETRTAVDWAEKIRLLVDEIEPTAKKIILVMDNLNTHCIGSLYKAFPPEEARRIARKLEVHYTPKHGSWLDIAEIGINIITRECLDRRITGIDELRTELKAWNDRYNKEKKPVNWQFTAENARIKLKSLYPNIQMEYEKRDERRENKRSGEYEAESKPNTKV